MEIANPANVANSCVMYDAIRQQWLYFDAPSTILSTHDVNEVVELLEQVDSLVRENGLYAVGFVTYGAAPAFDSALLAKSSGLLPLIWFGMYESARAFELPKRASPVCETMNWDSSLGRGEYETALKKIKRYLGAGESYQVNYTYTLHTGFDCDPWDYFLNMIQAQGSGYGAFINTRDWTVCSASPELFFTREEEKLISIPMKGTVRRDLAYADDKARQNWLQCSAKNRAENLMIVDMVRNDLSQIADPGSVKVDQLFEVKKFPTVWQMTSTVSCETSANTTEIFRALFPAASITGAPKVRTMQIISELEKNARDLYTGSIGFIAPNDSAQFNVAIRSVVVDKSRKKASYGVGGGIVWDSDIEDELQESRLKARILNFETPEFQLIESLLWSQEHGYYLLEDHLQRLSNSAEYFAFEIDIDAIRGQLCNHEDSLLIQDSLLRDSLIRDPLIRDYKIRLLLAKNGEIKLEGRFLEPVPKNYTIAFAKTPVQAKQDVYLYHKTTNRTPYKRALAECTDVDDVLLWNENGEVTESCIANVVIERGGRLVTPPVSCGLLPGIYRQFLLDSGKISEGCISVEDIRQSSAVYLINSVRKMWPVELVS